MFHDDQHGTAIAVLAALVAEPTPECIIPGSLDRTVAPAVDNAAWLPCRVPERIDRGASILLSDKYYHTMVLLRYGGKVNIWRRLQLAFPMRSTKPWRKSAWPRGESRSAFFRRAVEEHFRRAREREDVEQYLRGYQQYPETQEELALAESTLGYVMAENPWEDETDK